MTKGHNHFPYIQRLQRLNVCSLDELRRRSELTLAYGIFHGSYGFPRYMFFTLPSWSHLSGHDPKLCHRSFHLTRTKPTFSVQILQAIEQITNIRQ